MKTIATVKDPVCGMDIDPANDAGQSVYNGQTYHFCGNTCKEKFDMDPNQYATKAKTAKASSR